MSLFSFLKKKPSHEEKVDFAYKCFKQDAVNLVFPSGINQADIIITSLSKILKIELEKTDAKGYYEILSIYSDVLVRRISTCNSDNRIISVLLDKHGQVIKNSYIAQKVLSYCTVNMSNNSFALKTSKDIEALDLFDELLTQNKMQGQAERRDMLFKGQRTEENDYGYSKENPICTASVSSSEDYLSRLRTSEGEALDWIRKGSSCLENCNNIQNVMVDTYSLYLHGTPYEEIHICPYGHNSSFTPKGLILAANKTMNTEGNLIRESRERGLSVDTLLSIKRQSYENLLMKNKMKEKGGSPSSVFEDSSHRNCTSNVQSSTKARDVVYNNNLNADSNCEIETNKSSSEKKDIYAGCDPEMRELLKRVEKARETRNMIIREYNKR